MFFMRPGPPLSQSLKDRPPPPLSEGVDPLLVLLGKKEKWRLCMNRVKPLFEVVTACSPNLRTYLSWSLKNVPLRAELRCIGHYRAGVHPGFQSKTAQKLYPIPIWLKSPLLACEPHRKETGKYTREESWFLFKFFDIHTILAKTLGTLTQQLVKMTHFLSPRPPRFSVDVMDSYLFQHNQHCWEEGEQQKKALSTTFPSIYNR